MADPLAIPAGDAGELPGLLERPPDAHALLVLAHGAGAGMRHAFMEAAAQRLAERGVATLRYEFPYMAAGGRRPDRPPVARAAVRAAVAAGLELARGLPVFAGGKSFGGRMTSQEASAGGLSGVAGLVFLGFPLHPAGRPGTERADHLAGVRQPMLFVQGTRDRLAELELLRPVLDGLGPRATLHVEEGADHGFHVLKRSGRTDAGVLDAIADAVAAWMRQVPAGP
jgi:predicted alpha/beta-hydrolase family hydrolase